MGIPFALIISPYRFAMVGRVWFAGAALITSALAIPAVSQVNTASVNTTDNTPSTSAEATLATPTTSVLGELESLYNTSAWLPHGQALVPQLPQWATNGNSVLGTANAPQLPQWLNGPLPNGFPWGSRTSSNTNYYLNPPETGKNMRELLPYVLRIDRSSAQV